jgi:hypothetical protein
MSIAKEISMPKLRNSRWTARLLGQLSVLRMRSFRKETIRYGQRDESSRFSMPFPALAIASAGNESIDCLDRQTRTASFRTDHSKGRLSSTPLCVTGFMHGLIFS